MMTWTDTPGQQRTLRRARRLLKSTPTIALACLAFATSASASGTWSVEGGWHYPTERIAHNAMVDSANLSALAFWHHRNVFPNEHVTYFLVDDAMDLAGADAPTGAGGRGDAAGRIWLNVDVVKYAQSGQLGWRYDCERLWVLIAHELGHVGGLPHSATGLMGPAADIDPPIAKSWCRQQAAARIAARHARSALTRRHS